MLLPCLREVKRLILLVFVLLYVIEAEGEDLHDHLKEDFRPILLFVRRFLEKIRLSLFRGTIKRIRFLFLHDRFVL